MGSYKVQDKFRTNPLSLQPGGSTVTVHYSEGNSRIYDKIKSPKGYIGSLSMREDAADVVRIDINGEIFWERTDNEQNFY